MPPITFAPSAFERAASSSLPITRPKRVVEIVGIVERKVPHPWSRYGQVSQRCCPSSAISDRVNEIMIQYIAAGRNAGRRDEGQQASVSRKNTGR